MKKSLLSLLIFALIFTMAAPAFANTSEDLGDVTVPVERLKSLGVITGHGDGSFKPNDTITRAEFAAMAVRLVGLEGAAKVAAGATTFKDAIPAWAQGYVNVAAEQGIITGHGDGTFKPSDTVTQAEALTMLVRALGYEPAVNKDASWPTNYLVVASKIGLDAGVDVYSKAGATRGDTAIFANNALSTPKMIQVGFGSQSYFVVSGTQNTDKETLLANNLKATPSTEVLSASSLNADGELQFVNAIENAAPAKNSIVANGKVLADLLGHQVEVIKNAAGNVVFLNDAQPSKLVVTGQLSQDLTTTGDVYLKDVQDGYTLAQGAVFYSNDLKVSGPTVATTGSDVTLFLNADGDVRFAVATNYSAANVLFEQYYAKTSYRDASVTYSGGGSVTLTDNTVVKINGEVATAADLKADDVLYIVSNANGAVSIDAVRNSVTGKVTATAVVNGVEFYNVNGTAYARDTESTEVIALDSEYTFALNKDGKIRKVTPVDVAANSKMSVILDVYENVSVLDGQEVKTLDKVTYFSVADNEKVVAYVDTNVFVGTADKGTVGELTFTDGKITDYTPSSTVVANKTVASVDSKSIKVNIDASTAKTYLLNSATVVIDATKIADANASLTTLSNITKDDTVTVVLDGAGLYVEYLLLVTDAQATGDENLPTVTGLFVGAASSTTTADGTKYSVTLNVNGQVTAYEVNSAVHTALKDSAKNSIVTLSDANDSSLAYDAQAVTSTALTSLTSVSTTNKTFAADTTNGVSAAVSYIATSNTVVYVVDVDGNVSVGTFSDVKAAETAILGTNADVFVVEGSTTVGDYTEASTVVIVQK